MLENSTLACRMWRIHQRNISTDLQEHIFIDQNKYEIYFWSYMAISTLFGNSFLGIIWHFERFGGDTQKRSLQNRLASQIIVACILLMSSANILGANMSYMFASYEVLHNAIHQNLPNYSFHSLGFYHFAYFGFILASCCLEEAERV